MESEIQTYRDQLAYVNLSLEADPGNDDLLKLKNELVELIDLTTAAIAQTSAAAAKAAGGGEGSKAKGKGKESGGAKETTNWQDRGEYKAGMDCMAKYKDGKWCVRVPPLYLCVDTRSSQVPRENIRCRRITRLPAVHNHLQGLLLIHQRPRVVSPPTRSLRADPAAAETQGGAHRAGKGAEKGKGGKVDGEAKGQGG